MFNCIEKQAGDAASAFEVDVGVVEIGFVSLYHLGNAAIASHSFIEVPEGDSALGGYSVLVAHQVFYAAHGVHCAIHALVAVADTHEQEACAGHALFELGDGLFHGCAVVVVVAAVGSGNVQAIYENHQVVVPCAVEAAKHIIVYIAKIASWRAS